LRLLLFLMFPLLTFTQPVWTWSLHPEAGFKILSPITLTDHVKAVPTETDVIQYHQYTGGSVKDSLLSMAFVVDYYQVPASSESRDATYLRDFFENTIDPILNSISGSLVYMDIQREANQDICFWKASYQNGDGMIRGNCILTKDKYYGLQVFGLAKNKPEDQMNKFLKSFQLLEP
jgi:hypothetical protein